MAKRKKNKNKRRSKGSAVTRAPASTGGAPVQSEGSDSAMISNPEQPGVSGGTERGQPVTVSKSSSTGADEPGVLLQPFGEGPRFSVLMAAYNRADLIHVAIDSVLAQDFQDYELVIVDDGSTDNTSQVVTGYADSRIRYIRKDQNEGRSPTRNRAIAEARGEFVLWMADDDLLVPGLLTLYDKVLRENPTVDVVYGDLQLFNHDTGADENVFTPNDWTGRRYEVIGSKLYGSCVPDGGTATRRTIYSLVGSGPYDHEFVRAQDYELWSRIVGQANFHKVDQIVYRYRRHSGGTSWGEFIDLTLDSKIIRRHLQRHPLRTLFPKLEWSNEAVATSIACLRIAKNLRIYGDHGNALRFLDAVRGSESQPEAIEHRVRSLVAQGDLDAAEQVVSGITRSLGRAHIVGETTRTLLDDAKTFRVNSARLLQAADHQAVIKAAQVFGQKYEATYDSMLQRGLAHQALGDNEAAVNCLCLAARLNLDDEIATAAVKTLVATLGFNPKTDLAAMRRRLRERFFDVPADESAAPTTGPLVSVIVATVESECDQAIQSVLGQTYETMEILVPEGTPLIDPRMRHLRADDDQPWSLHRAGLARAQGELIAWIDDGAVWYPGHLARCVGALVGGSDVVVSHGHLIRTELDWCGREDSLVVESFWLSQPSFLRSGNLAGPVLPLSLVVHRPSIVEWPQLVEGRWAFTLDLLSVDAVETLPHPGGAAPLPKEQAIDEKAPPFERAGELLAVYDRYTRQTLFDPPIRKAQNARLIPIGMYQVEMGRTSVIVLGGRERSEIEACLSHLKEHTWVAHNVIIVVSRVSESNAEWLNSISEESDDVKVQQCAENVSLAKAINEGLSKATGEYVAVLDVESRPSAGWLGRLQWWGQSEADFGAVSPEVIETPYSRDGFERHRIAHWGQAEPSRQFDPRCVVLRRDGLDRVGGMDVVLGAIGCEWDDFTLRLRSAGVKLGIVKDVLVTSRPLEVEENERGIERFLRRWGAPPALMHDREPNPFDAGIHFCAAGAEEGFRPDTRPVEVCEAKERNLLIIPPWGNSKALGGLIAALEGLSTPDTGIWLRAIAGHGAQSARALSDILRAHGKTEDTYPDLHIVDAHLAPEREGGLFVAADAVFVEEEWETAGETIRRAADCGRTILRSRDDLTAWLASG